MTFITYGSPIGKPRMTRRDVWKQRPCVVRYRRWCDELRRTAGLVQKVTFVRPHHLTLVAYFPIPPSWPKRVQVAAAGQPHAHKPDLDNIAKGIMDALLEQDQNIVSLQAEKYWDDGRGGRVEVTLQELQIAELQHWRRVQRDREDKELKKLQKIWESRFNSNYWKDSRVRGYLRKLGYYDVGEILEYTIEHATTWKGRSFNESAWILFSALCAKHINNGNGAEDAE